MSEQWTDEQEHEQESRSVRGMIDVYAMFPEAAKRVRILEELKRSWPVIVRNFARASEPYCLGVNELYICTKNPKVTGQLMRMKGSILRVMTNRWGYEPMGEFTLKITDEREKAKKLAVNRPVKRAAQKIEVSEDRVSKYMECAPETLPEDINYALSHLRAFLEEINRRV